MSPGLQIRSKEFSGKRLEVGPLISRGEYHMTCVESSINLPVAKDNKWARAKTTPCAFTQGYSQQWVRHECPGKGTDKRCGEDAHNDPHGFIPGSADEWISVGENKRSQPRATGNFSGREKRCSVMPPMWPSWTFSGPGCKPPLISGGSDRWGFHVSGATSGLLRLWR